MTRSNPAIDVSALRNNGMLRVREEKSPPAERTFIVIGVARGGTTMVSRALHDMGVHMGDRISAVVEDVEVFRPMEDGDTDALRQIVARRNAKYPKWGFKRPAAITYIRKFESEFRNPNYLIVFRDILAVTNRNRLSVGQDALSGLRIAAQQYVKLAELAASLGAPTLLVSYEKGLLEPDDFVTHLAAFAGVDDPVLLAKARAGVAPGNERYLEESRARRGLGRLDAVVDRVVTGWAAMSDVPRPVEVRLVLNDRELGVVLADRPRPDARRHEPAGAHGFEFALPGGLELCPGDVLTARIVGEIKDLANCPFRVTAGKPAAAGPVASGSPASG